MSNENSELNKVITEPEIGNDGVGHSDATRTLGEAPKKASPKELEIALVASNNTINNMNAELERLKAENAKLKSEGKASTASDNSIDKLAQILANAVSQNARPTVPPEEDNINRSSGFNERQNIDGNSLMEAQSKMLAFKNETKVPISIAKAFQAQFGPSLSVTVNGVRVSIPCDGKTYYINETHALHAKERIAKVDRLLANQEPDIKEYNA